MGGIVSCFVDIISHAFTSCCITAIIYIWVMQRFDEWDTQRYLLNYTDIIEKMQFFRIFTAPLTHSTLLHLLINVMCLWNLRFIEDHYGTWFMMRYSVFLLVSEAYIAVATMSLAMRFINNPNVSVMISNLKCDGCGGLVLAWLSFQAIELSYKQFPTLFLLFGLFPLPATTAPLLILSLYYLFISRSNSFTHLAGMISGLLMGLGPFKVLQSAYFTVCILFDIAIITLVLSMGSRSASSVGNINDSNMSSNIVSGIQRITRASQGDFIQVSEIQAVFEENVLLDNEGHERKTSDEEDDAYDAEEAQQRMPLLGGINDNNLGSTNTWQTYSSSSSREYHS